MTASAARDVRIVPVDSPMSWTWRCECGIEVMSPTEDDLVDAAGRHLGERHPELVAPPPPADVLSMAERRSA